ncbi:hypothetical protein [Methylomonas sp. 11b]|uniref:hypothetical protein n=1 Tax=Methylomonas sp. 11b TaxID=1168169 RepID=UPI00047EBF36|nr:hypothetical protein [Methylomonas sp. 11b]
MDKFIEKWKCTECAGPDYPCFIEIHSGGSEPTEDFKKRSRFYKRHCPADNSRFPQWEKVLNEQQKIEVKQRNCEHVWQWNPIAGDGRYCMKCGKSELTDDD